MTPAKPSPGGGGGGPPPFCPPVPSKQGFRRLGPLVKVAAGVRPPQRLDGVVTASGNSLAGACVLQLAKPVAPGNRGLFVEGVADLSDAAERLARVAIRREFVPGEQQRRAQSAAVITVDHNGKIRDVRADA